MKNILFVLLAVALIVSCSDKKRRSISELESKMNGIAEQYVKLVLETGEYYPGYVDAYYGPKEWLPTKDTSYEIDSTIINSLNQKTDDLLNKLESLKDYKATEIETLRYRFLYKQLLSVKGMILIIAGGTFPFDQEAKILYDADPPHFTDDHFQKILDKLDKLVPETGNLQKRVNAFRNNFFIPNDKLDTIITTAINECRRRTLKHIVLPPNENFKVEYVKDKPWGAYNWYKGNYFSLIQINTDLPADIDRAIGLASHEGYPGHHVFNVLLEKNLVKNRNWVEFSVYPLFSPISLLAEGTANYGVNVIFPGNDRTEFERKVLFPLAGLNTADADLYYKILNLLKELSYAGNEAARNYLDGKRTKDQTIAYLQKYLLFTKEKAEKRLAFIEQYRSYVINYNLGEDIVKNYIEKNGGTIENPERRWKLFKQLISLPQTPSELK
ncbi:hypothetical protein LJE82_09225 [bacterium BMS3Abin03]|nr:hypothetical protein [bacterium BMS3Abin03]